jgi:aryl-alcohol dehydrogenase-like predicted oxidoreductase
VLQNPNVASAIIGASRPEQVTSNVKAAGVKLSPEIMEKIEVALAGVAVTDGSINSSPAGRPS